MMRFLLILLLGMCACEVSVVMWSSLVVCEVVLIPNVDAVVAVTVRRVLLFVLHVYMLRECEGAMVTEILGEVWWRGVSIWVVHVVQVL